ncbi:MAG TPA: FliI/YscN family ATPase [Gemmatimonadales bacterium]|nr:FliI/YscN family ATPase [Gemmatimonadales bacterium]
MTEALLERVRSVRRLASYGRVTRVIGQVVEASAIPVAVGEVCRLTTGQRTVLAMVAGFQERGVMLLPIGEVEGIQPGATVAPLGRPLYVGVGDGLVGRVLDGLGNPIDGRGPTGVTVQRSLHADPPSPLDRPPVVTPFTTGVRAIDGLESLGRGQRVGIMAGSGVGKSVLLGMIARGASSDVNVIALLGERGREVREFIERDLGPEGLARSVVVVATSDQSPVIRSAGALVATTIAEYFRDTGRDVLLLMDSVTRVAMAWREVGLSVGEPPTTKGYPPSVFAGLPRLLERAGASANGTITGLYTVLVEGDDFNEPVTDAARSILDGHVVLTRRLAVAKHFPAIDVLESVSRVRDAVIDDEHRDAANTLVRLEAAYKAHEDLIAVGAYQKGANPVVDTAIALRPELLAFLQQRPEQHADLAATRAQVVALAGRAAALEKGGHG